MKVKKSESVDVPRKPAGSKQNRGVIVRPASRRRVEIRAGSARSGCGCDIVSVDRGRGGRAGEGGGAWGGGDAGIGGAAGGGGG